MINYQRLYEYRFRNVDQARRELVWGAIAPVVYEWLGRPKRILDPAAGRCEFLNAVPSQERWGVDAVKYTEALPRPGSRLIVSEIMEADLPNSYFDGIFVSNFLEHLDSPEDVATFLEKMRETIKPGGRIAIIGPNFRHCPDEYFDFADHRVILTEQSAAEHLHAAGFSKSGRSVPGSCPTPSAVASLPTPHWSVPTFRAPLAWRLLGKQFLVIGQRAPVEQPAPAKPPGIRAQ